MFLLLSCSTLWVSILVRVILVCSKAWFLCKLHGRIGWRVLRVTRENVIMYLTTFQNDILLSSTGMIHFASNCEAIYHLYCIILPSSSGRSRRGRAHVKYSGIRCGWLWWPCCVAISLHNLIVCSLVAEHRQCVAALIRKVNHVDKLTDVC